jgi:hypothetical protein
MLPEPISVVIGSLAGLAVSVLFALLIPRERLHAEAGVKKNTTTSQGLRCRFGRSRFAAFHEFVAYG